MNNKKSATPVVDANARLYLWNNNNNTEISVLFPILASSNLIEAVARLVGLSFIGKKTLVALLCRERGGLSGVVVHASETVTACRLRDGIVCITVDYVDRSNLNFPKATATVHLNDGTITLTGDSAMVKEIIKRLSGR